MSRQIPPLLLQGQQPANCGYKLGEGQRQKISKAKQSKTQLQDLPPHLQTIQLTKDVDV